MSEGEGRMCLYCFCLTCWKPVLLQSFHTIWPSNREVSWLSVLKIFTKGSPHISGSLTIISNIKTSKPEHSKKEFSLSLLHIVRPISGLSPKLPWHCQVAFCSHCELAEQNKTLVSARVNRWIWMCGCGCASQGFWQQNKTLSVCQHCLHCLHFEAWMLPRCSLKSMFWAESSIASLVLPWLGSVIGDNMGNGRAGWALPGIPTFQLGLWATLVWNGNTTAAGLLEYLYRHVCVWGTCFVGILCDTQCCDSFPWNAYF